MKIETNLENFDSFYYDRLFDNVDFSYFNISEFYDAIDLKEEFRELMFEDILHKAKSGGFYKGIIKHASNKTKYSADIEISNLFIAFTLDRFGYEEQSLKIYRDCVETFLRYQVEYEMNSAKKRSSRSNNGYPTEDFEEIMILKNKKYDSDLKIPEFDIEDRSHIFYKKKVVITGTFQNFSFREEMARWIKEVGGDNNTSISKRTDFVIVGEDAGWRKMEQINELEIKTLNEKEFLALFPDKTPIIKLK